VPARFQPVLNKMISDGVSIITNSFAYCEDQTTQADVNSIDSLNQQAAAAGITVFNAAGDSGTNCLDGSQNTVAVPADSPNATAVGGTSLTYGPGLTYGSETWWNGLNETPTNGQGGYGVSKFFPAPAYQVGLGFNGRSVPDLSVAADPIDGTWICQISGGGCPTGLLNGGTSGGAPMWAAFQAILNQSVGQKLGFVNPIYYGFANMSSFHNELSMGTTFAQVGLGSPDIDALHLLLCGQTAGSPDATESLVQTLVEGLPAQGVQVPADGTPKGGVRVTLRDAQSDMVSGQTVTLATASNTAQISPASAQTDTNGSVVFSVTDLTPETVTFTATTNGAALNQKPTLTFSVPPATSGNIVASLGNNPADGITPDTITVTLQDSLGRPTPGKVVTLSQGSGFSSITALSAVTDSNGHIQYSVTDTHPENVSYAATDVTDLNLPVPGSAMVDFTNGAGGCYSSPSVTGGASPANGYMVNTFANGFVVSSGNQGFSYNCFGAYGMAWDASGNMYVTDWPTGDIYKFGPSGGVADAGHLFTTVKAPATGLAIDPAANMFASEGSVSGANGDIVPVDLATGTVGAAIASGIPCLGNMAIDPSIPAFYVNDFCSSGPVSPNIWQVTGIDGPNPSTIVYAQTPDNFENFNLAVAPDGTVYDVYAAGAAGTPIARITKGSPPTVTTLTAADSSLISLSGGLGMTVGGMQTGGDAQFVIAPFNSQANTQPGLPQGVFTVDLAGKAPAPGVQLTSSDFSGLSNFAIGPDGCLYVAGGPTVSKITKADGTCGFGPTTQLPAISLTPAMVSPNPMQGSTQAFTATLHYVGAPGGVPVTLLTAGANANAFLLDTDTSGQATFSYTGALPGVDNLIASATVNGAPVVSNPAQVTWTAGQDVTFLTLNPSPKAGVPGQLVTVVASLSDVSQNPAIALSGQMVNFKLGGAQCSGATNSSGIASCSLTPGGSGIETLSASFASTSTLVGSNASTGFSVVTPPQSTACSGPIISAKLLSGDATPAAGSSGSWTFQIAICPGHNLTNVSAQGGTDNWTMVTSTSPSGGSLSVRKLNKNNEVLTWTWAT
jgi:hypothetical protein